jgi:hypothetical protein
LPRHLHPILSYEEITDTKFGCNLLLPKPLR